MGKERDSESMNNLGNLLKQAQKFQSQVSQIQAELAEQRVEVSAGGGMVTAVVNGKLELMAVRIDPSLLESPDAEMLQDLIVAAVNEGVRAARKMIEDEMGKLTGGLGIKLPGMG